MVDDSGAPVVKSAVFFVLNVVVIPGGFDDFEDDGEREVVMDAVAVAVKRSRVSRLARERVRRS